MKTRNRLFLFSFNRSNLELTNSFFSQTISNLNIFKHIDKDRFRSLSNHKYLIELGVIVLLVLATVVIQWRMLRDGINGLIDLKWHIAWLQHFAKELSEGIWYPRWLAGTNYGYGSPTFVFYPPLIYYFGSLLKFSGLSMEQVITALFSIAVFLSGINFYIFGRSRWGVISSSIGALTYMSAPYLAFDVYWRGGVASVFAQAWIPLGWWLTDKAIAKPQRKWKVGVALFWTTMALTHLPSLVLCALIWPFYTLFFLRQQPWKKVARVLFAGAIGLGIASFYLLPAILEQSSVNTKLMKEFFGRFNTYMFGDGLPFFYLNVQDLYLDDGQFNMSHIFTQQSIGMIVLTMIALLCCSQKVIKEVKFWGTFALILVFLMNPLSSPIWALSSTMQTLQFPWRFLLIFSFVGAAIFAAVTKGILQLKWRSQIIAGAIVAIIILANLHYSYALSRRFVTLGNPGRANIEKMDYLVYIKKALNDPYTDKLVDVREYRPHVPGRITAPEPIENQPKFTVLEGEANVEVKNWDTYQRILKIDAKEASTLRIRTYYYPAWHLYINGRSQPLTMAEDGTMQVKLQSGSYRMELRYQSTPALQLGTVLSLISAIILILLTFLSKAKSIKSRTQRFSV